VQTIKIKSILILQHYLIIFYIKYINIFYYWCAWVDKLSCSHSSIFIGSTK